MEFRLTYRGALHAGSHKDRQKQDLRRIFHRQLAELWRQQPLLGHGEYLSSAPKQGSPSILHTAGAFTFAPLVSSRLLLVAELNVLFLRPQEPGSLVGHAGDLDNRLKTLFDALRMPAPHEIPSGDAPGPSETPFHCLLEDDALVVAVAVATDRLLNPDAPRNHVDLVIHVRLKGTQSTWGNAGLIG